MGLFSKRKEDKKDDQGAKQEPAVKADKKAVKDDEKMSDLYAGKTPKKEKAKKEPSDKAAKKATTAKPVKGDTKDAYRVLIKPVVSEKATFIGQFNQYVFEVHPSTNKIVIKKAIQALYGVEPIKINIINVSGKSVRYGRNKGKTKRWKKAIVTLKQGQSIQVYEGI